MNRKKPTITSKNSYNQNEFKSSAQIKVKTSQEETLKFNLLIDEDEEDFDIKPKRLHSSENADSRRGSKAESITSASGDEVLTDGNDDECYFCEDGGEILCCDNCFRSFHLECVGLDEGPEGDWICPYCRDLQDSKSRLCSNCQQDFSSTAKHEKITCAKCLKK